MQVEIWSDITCPWCYIGLARWEKALASFGHRDALTVVHRSFELDPNASREVRSVLSMLASKFGRSRDEILLQEERMFELAASEGLDYTADRPNGNTFDAHRLLHLARTAGLEGALRDAIWASHFGKGQSVFDDASLVTVAVGAGLREDDVRRVLGSDEFADDVRADEARAQAFGISGVPFFVLGDPEGGQQAFGVSGAQPAEVFTQALAQAWEANAPAA